ncbi:8555_t:CDS:2 [Funneliformis caledonium]|uniref:8555_t:CDS:1 n=1 Tax=Funneliformis caledonium TaxID=1117310 RepID=A0A9N8VYI4_9GLOM|nr:8555_t:CDS:2 [Funneliformis caledonium]
MEYPESNFDRAVGRDIQYKYFLITKIIPSAELDDDEIRELISRRSFWLNPPMEITNTIGYPVTDPEINSEKFTSKSFPTYDFIGIPAEGCELEFDVIVISSGAGGGFVAAELAKAGNSVLKGKYYHQSELTTRA